MAGLLETRELRRSVHLPADKLQQNIEVPILSQLRARFEGKCIPEGYVKEDSITVLHRSLGRVNLIKGGLDYVVQFHADICMPHPGQVFRGIVVLRSKIGIHVELKPMKILLPRDLHMNNSQFEDIKEQQEVEFEVKGSRFQQGDDSIVVLGQLRAVVQTQAPEPERPTVDEPLLAAAPASSDDVRKSVTVPTEHLQSKDKPPRKTRVIAKPVPQANESGAQGTA